MTEGEDVGVQLVALESPVAGDQEQETPPDPVRGVEDPAPIVADPEATAVGSGLTVTVALPEDVPEHAASETAVTVYVVVEAGLTARVAGLAPIPDCVTPSDHVTVHGAVPVRAAWIVADEPAQTDVDPLTAAVGRAFTVTVTAALLVETHPLPSVTVNV